MYWNFTLKGYCYLGKNYVEYLRNIKWLRGTSAECWRERGENETGKVSWEV